MAKISPARRLQPSRQNLQNLELDIKQLRVRVNPSYHTVELLIGEYRMSSESETTFWTLSVNPVLPIDLFTPSPYE